MCVLFRVLFVCWLRCLFVFCVLSPGPVAPTAISRLPTAIWRLRLRSGSVQCDLELRLRSGSARYDREMAVEVRQRPL